MDTTITVSKELRKRLAIDKNNLGLKTIEEVILRLYDIATQIKDEEEK